MNPSFNIKGWSSKTRHRGLLVAGRSLDPRRELGRLLTICDAKSLYDHLHSETAGCTADKRTATEIQIVRSSLHAQGGEVCWIDHSNMYADALTSVTAKFHFFKHSRRPLESASQKNQPLSRNIGLIQRAVVVFLRLRWIQPHNRPADALRSALC